MMQNGTSPIAAPARGAAPSSPRALERVAGLSVVRLEGDFYEMGRQHGSLLAEGVKQGPVPYYARMV